MQLSKMSRHRDWDVTCKVYIGNLGNNASKYDLEDAFAKYGPLRNVWVARNPPGFAFVWAKSTSRNVFRTVTKWR